MCGGEETHKSKVIHSHGARSMRKKPGAENVEVPSAYDQIPEEVARGIALNCTADGSVPEYTPEHPFLVLGAPGGPLGVGVHDP